MKPTRTCRNCGDAIFDTGNYTYKLRKSKRIPQKALKAMKKSHCDDEATMISSSLIESHSKFSKFLVQRSHPKNVVEITCGNCDFVFKMNTPKPLERFQKGSPDDVTITGDQSTLDVSSGQTRSNKRKKNKKPKELNAGLILSPVSFGTSPNCSTRSDRTSLSSSMSSSPVATSTPKSNFKITAPSSFKQKANSSKNKQKSLESLRKGMLKSNVQSGGASLKDFLSSM